MNIQIRLARKNDYESVNRIMTQVQNIHVEWRPDIYKPNENLIPEDVFEKIIENGTFYVAESEGVVVGILEIVFRHVESPSHVTRNFIFIDSMAIDEKYRGMGIGHQMFDFSKKLKKEKNLDGIELQVNARNSAAYEMYKKYGFTEKSINMELLE